MYDVYLSGTLSKEWREYFKNNISTDITVFDPLEFEHEKHEQLAKELIHIESECDIIVFYLNEKFRDIITMIQIGEAKGKQIIMCLDGNVNQKEDIIRYCEYRGIPIIYSLDNLITAVEEYLAEIEMCSEICENLAVPMYNEAC